MATYNLCEENNQQNERIIKQNQLIIKQIQLMDANLRMIHIGIRFESLYHIIDAQTKKIEELHNTDCNKLDRMIALLEKIASEGNEK